MAARALSGGGSVQDGVSEELGGDERGMLCFPSFLKYEENEFANLFGALERKGLLHPHPPTPRRPFPCLLLQSPTRLLRRKNWQRQGFPNLDARSASV